MEGPAPLPANPDWHKDPYANLPLVGPYEVQIGSALITMVEPHPGHEIAYNRWYEDDHFYAGAMAEPWMFAGRRWVAPRELQALREPADSPICRPLSRGKWISLYWITRGRYEDHFRWTASGNARMLQDAGRKYPHRDNMFTAFYAYAGAGYRDREGPRDIHALNYPYNGLVIESLSAGDAARRPAMLQWLRDQYLPRRLAGSPVAMCLVFTPIPMPPNPAQSAYDVPGWEARVLLAWFVEVHPRDCWADYFAGKAGAVRDAGYGVELVAPFIPTLPGTNTYVDQLR
jgi:hypothetical protein